MTVNYLRLLASQLENLKSERDNYQEIKNTIEKIESSNQKKENNKEKSKLHRQILSALENLLTQNNSTMENTFSNYSLLRYPSKLPDFTPTNKSDRDKKEPANTPSISSGVSFFANSKKRAFIPSDFSQMNKDCESFRRRLNGDKQPG